MKTYEHTILIHRGRIDEPVQAMIANMGADGWALIAAYATQEGSSAVNTHHFVLRRDIEEAPISARPPEPAKPKGRR